MTTDFASRVSEISQLTPLSEVDMTFWGMPGHEDNDPSRFPKGSPGAPAGCPSQADASCISAPSSVSISVKPLIDYPTTCNGDPLITKLSVRSYQDPKALSTEEASYPPVDGCEKGTFNPVLSANLTSKETDSASGLDLNFRVPQTLGKTPSPSQAKSVTVAFPPGLTINPDAADGQSDCKDSEANFDSEAPASCPDNAKIGTVSRSPPRPSTAPSKARSTSVEPKPGDQYRLFMVVSGFGINAKLIGSFKPDPTTGQPDRFLLRPPPGPLRGIRHPPLRL